MSQAQLEQARVHVDRRQIDQAIPLLIEHLNDDFHDDEALFMLGACYLSLGKHGMAAACTRLAIQIRGDKGYSFPEAMKNLGACFKGENRMGAAEEIWRMALEIAPNDVEKSQILSNLGGLHINDGSPEKAVPFFDQALSLRSDCMGAQFNRGMAHLELGNWRQGWIDYDMGFRSGDRPSRKYAGLPEWDGTKGKTVIVWGEQGVGDEIMFSSVLPDVIKDCKRVILDCHPRLVDLYRRSFPGLEVHGTRKVMSYIDWLDHSDAEASICLSALCRMYRNSDESFPGTPFLTPGAFLEDMSDELRIGISWEGGTKKTRNDLRSIPLDQWGPILRAAPNARFFSLQYTKDAARQVCEFEEKTGIRVSHYPGWVECKNYDRTISFISSLDLVVTVCTTVYHAAGSIGTPVWVMVPSKPAWRYTKPNEAWYRQTARFFRQEGNDWAPVIENIARELADFRRIPRTKSAVARTAA